jgi:hypothetical protein
VTKPTSPIVSLMKLNKSLLIIGNHLVIMMKI